MKKERALTRLNLHIRPRHLDELTNLADLLSRWQGREVRLGEALELALEGSFTRFDEFELLEFAKPDAEQPHWKALGPIFRTR
ncbi:hypothetical protein SAMN05216214_1206 [Atopomonas hussainii]|uniref:Uncharacterized protein n=1 Tax=Atopomonas hussainii TaxID=1429083 RepID=A0A1H7SP37_9GAMM|nr:hypothetical protein [Atopomonas hussainii]SEL74411.1 hypothetical protein SAMN05216214_1206 [Atopomonas hussainii]